MHPVQLIVTYLLVVIATLALIHMADDDSIDDLNAAFYAIFWPISLLFLLIIGFITSIKHLSTYVRHLVKESKK
jgi:hypothetical protein